MDLCRSWPHCLTPIAILIDEIVQTDLESSMTATCDANIQACPPITTVSAQTATTVDYDSPMDPMLIDILCSRAATASSDTILGTVWKHAFKAGQDDTSQIVDDMRVTDVLKVGFKKGQVYGIIQEREQWETAGHSQTCFVTTSSSTATTNAGTQVDLVTPSYSDSSTQTLSDFNPLDNPESVDLL